VRHRVPSHFNWNLLRVSDGNFPLFYRVAKILQHKEWQWKRYISQTVKFQPLTTVTLRMQCTVFCVPTGCVVIRRMLMEFLIAVSCRVCSCKWPLLIFSDEFVWVEIVAFDGLRLPYWEPLRYSCLLKLELFWIICALLKISLKHKFDEEFGCGFQYTWFELENCSTLT